MRNIKSLVRISPALVVAIAATMFGACKTNDMENDDSVKHGKYTCAHHPEVVQDGPGTCPKCQMALTRK